MTVKYVGNGGLMHALVQPGTEGVLDFMDDASQWT